MVSKACGGRSTEAAKDELQLVISSSLVKCLILALGEIYLVIEIQENVNLIRPKIGCHGNSNCLDISRTFNRID